MTHRIQKSKIAALGIQDFAAAVDQHIAELEAHARQMREVAAGRAEPYPAPDPNPEVDAAVRRDGNGFVADFEIVDDTADRSAQDLRAAKILLMSNVAGQERTAANAVIPEGKRRLLSMKYQEVMQTRQAASLLAQARSTRDQLGPANADVPPEVIKRQEDAMARADAAIEEAKRALEAILEERGVSTATDQVEADEAFLTEYNTITAKLRRIERHGAELHDAIEDLPDMAALAAWTPTPFP